MTSLLSPLATLHIAAWGLGEFLIAIIVIAACIGILLIAFKAFGLSVPPWVVQIGWIVIVAVVAIVAIRLILSL